MYLYVFRDGKCRTVTENISPGDMLGVAERLLTIFRFFEGKFERIVKDETKFFWVPVPAAKPLFAGNESLNAA